LNKLITCKWTQYTATLLDVRLYVLYFGQMDLTDDSLTSFFGQDDADIGGMGHDGEQSTHTESENPALTEVKLVWPY